MCWSNYKIDPFQNNEKKEHFLSYAIRFTDDALHKYGIELDKESRENEELIYLIKNNLAFYFAECYRFEMRVLGKDLKEIRTLAIDYADEIKKKIRRFPARAGSWIHTCEYVKRYCEDCNT